MKTKLVLSQEKLQYCNKAIPGLAEKLLAKEEFLNDSALKFDQEWRQKRIGYFRTKIRFDMLKSVTEKSELSKEIRNLSLLEQQTVAEINQNLRISREQHFQGLLNSHLTKLKLSDRSTKIVETEIRTKLLQTFRDLLSHYTPYNTDEMNTINNSAEVYKRTSNLVSLIKDDLDCLERLENHKKSKYDEDTDINAEKQKQQTLEEHFHILNQIVDIHLTERMPQAKHHHADHLAAKVKTLEMKLKSVEEDILCLTYTKEACTELEKVRRKMLAKMESVRSEVAQLDKHLTNYKSISGSSNYEQLVEQYGRIKGEIEGKLWVLKELKTSEDVN